MEAKARALRLALLATLAMILFGFTLAVTGPELSRSLSSPDAGSLGATYTFDTYSCVVISSDNRDTSCTWHGTVTVNGHIEATDVAYRDQAPEDAQPGDQVDALWSVSNPTIAWNLESSRAWLNMVGSTILAGVTFLLFLWATIYWWRQFAKESKKAAAKNSSRSAPPVNDRDSELTHSSS